MRRRKPFQRQYAEQPRLHVQTIRDQDEVLAALAAEGEDADPASLVAAHGAIGEAWRMLGQLDKATPHLVVAVDTARANGLKKQLVANLIRLATARQYAGAHEAAVPLFEEALALAAATGVAEDFAHQHFGKCLAELGEWDRAIGHFERALAQREARGDVGLIDSTREALEAARAAAGRA